MVLDFFLTGRGRVNWGIDHRYWRDRWLRGILLHVGPTVPVLDPELPWEGLLAAILAEHVCQNQDKERSRDYQGKELDCFNVFSWVISKWDIKWCSPLYKLISGRNMLVQDLVLLIFFFILFLAFLIFRVQMRLFVKQFFKIHIFHSFNMWSLVWLKVFR